MLIDKENSFFMKWAIPGIFSILILFFSSIDTISHQINVKNNAGI